MIIKIRKIGNSAGILIPKKMLEHLNIKEEVELKLTDGAIEIKPLADKVRSGWKVQFIKAEATSGKEALLDENSNEFDKEEWTW